MTEQEILHRLVEAEKELQNAKRALADARRKWTDAETDVISTSINRDRIKEELRVHRNTVPLNEPTPQDNEIQEFRDKYPEICTLARERDAKRGENE